MPRPLECLKTACAASYDVEDMQMAMLVHDPVETYPDAWRHRAMDNRRIKAESNGLRDTSGDVTQEQVDAWVASLSPAERLALAADLAEADERLNGTRV